MNKNGYDKARRKRLKESGICYGCRGKAIAGQTKCGECIEKTRKRNRDYYERNKERIQKISMEYHYSNRDKCLEKSRKYRAEKPYYFKELLFGGNREASIKRDGYQCSDCGMSREDHKKKFGCDLHVDHMDNMGSRSSRPNHDLRNLKTRCARCHLVKTKKFDMPSRKHHD